MVEANVVYVNHKYDMVEANVVYVNHEKHMNMNLKRVHHVFFVRKIP